MWKKYLVSDLALGPKAFARFFNAGSDIKFLPAIFCSVKLAWYEELFKACSSP